MPLLRRLALGLAIASVTTLVSIASVHAATAFAPNHFLGSCLDAQWVRDTEAKLKISSTARDDLWRLLEPHLHGALPTRRFVINDKRINNKTLNEIFTPACTKTPFTFWGVGAQVDPTTGTVTNAGSPAGSLVIEHKNWASSQLTTLVFAILAQEVLGYNVSFYGAPNSADMGARMSSSAEGRCTPVHANLEEWGRDYTAFLNEMYRTGIQSYVGRSGLYTTRKFVEAGLRTAPVFNGDFYRDFATSDGLISALQVDLITKNKAFYPVAPPVCADGVMGCKDSCSKTDTCTAREAAGGKCLAIALMYPTYDDGKAEAIFANNYIPSYHCFLGFRGVESYAVAMESANVPVAFYHFEPDPFHYINENKFRRIFLPRSLPELTALNTATFGENGYGKPTGNPIAVDFALTTLNLYAASLLQDHAPIASLLSRMTLTELDMSTLLKSYVGIQYKGHPVFSAACAWVRDNYASWKLWLDRLPLCNLFEHVAFSFHHCDDDGAASREVRWAWREPHPQNVTEPYVCDGGQAQLPATITTSKSCDWLNANIYVWFAWTVVLPVCDAQFYAFRVSDCDARAKRTATYYWLLPDPADPTQSRECRQTQGGVALPATVELACEYAPFESPLAQCVAILAAILAVVLVSMGGFVVKYRHEPIIKRSQFEFLLAMLLGGILLCGAAVVYAGEPTQFLCAARPLVTSLGFTLVFGALVVKSLRVYRVFLSGAMKRVVLSTRAMFKILGVFVSVDLLILLTWFLLDFPRPYRQPTVVGALNGATIGRHVCASSSFIFTALLIFWKAIVLFMGLYLSFLIRNVSSDFQESIWIFASSLVVLFGSIIILPMAYLVELPADVFYVFLAFMLLACTTLVMGMMLAPKMRRLHERSNDMTATTHGDSRGESSSNQASEDASKPSDTRKVSKVRLGLRAQVSVTPVETFRPQSAKTEKSKRSRGGGPGAPDSSDDED